MHETLDEPRPGEGVAQSGITGNWVCMFDVRGWAPGLACRLIGTQIEALLFIVTQQWLEFAFILLDACWVRQARLVVRHLSYHLLVCFPTFVTHWFPLCKADDDDYGHDDHGHDDHGHDDDHDCGHDRRP